MAYLGHKPAVGENNSFRILDDISSFVLTFDGSSASVVGLSDETITITENNHRFITGQRVSYSNGGGGNITGLTNGQAYFVINHSKTQIKLASSASNALAGTAINLTGLGTGSSHTLTLAFDGVNTKFVPTFGDGMHDTLIKRAAQLVISLNGVIQQPHDTATPSTGFGVDSLGNLIFSTAPASTDIFWAHVLATNTVTFDSSDNDVDTFTGNGSTTSFTLSKIPPDNRNILVTIDGVVQYPSDAANTRSYTLSENVMTFVSAPGNGTSIQVRHIGYAGPAAGGGGGVTGFYGRTGNVSLIATDNILANDATFSGNVSIAKTLTYEDVTDIDSVGLITARSGIKDQTLTAGHVVFAGTGGRLTGEANLFYDSSNDRLGIGTNIPASNLQVDGTALSLINKVNVTNTLLKVENTSTGNAGVNIKNADGEFTFLANKRLRVQDEGNGGIERLSLHQTGNLGIGTTNPVAKLQLEHSGLNAELFRTWTTTGSVRREYFLKGPTSGNGNDPYRWCTGNSHSWEVDNSEKMRINYLGNVGIGTENPDTLVEIGNAIGTGTANLLKLTSYTNSQSSRPALVFWNNNPNTAQAQISAKGGASYNASKLHFAVANSSRVLADRACIDEYGTFIIGSGETRRNTKGSNQHQVLLIEGNGNNSTRMSMIRSSNDDNGPEIQLIKTRGTSIGSVTKPNQNDYIGSLVFIGGDDTDLYARGAEISVQATGTPANDRIPSDIIFSTTPTSGATAPQRRLRITSEGRIGIDTDSPSAKLNVVDTSNDGAVSQLLKLGNNSSGSGTGAGIQLGAGSGNAGNSVLLSGFYDGTGTSFTVKTCNTFNGAQTEKFRIKNDGIVCLDNTTGAIVIGDNSVSGTAAGAKMYFRSGTQSQTSASTDMIQLALYDQNSKRNGTESAGSWKSKIQFLAAQINGGVREGAYIQQDIKYNNFSGGSTKMRADLVFATRGDAQTSSSDPAAERLRINHRGEMIMSNAATQEFIQVNTTNNTTRGVISLAGKDGSGNAVTLKMGGFGDTSRGEIFTHSNHALGFATNNAATQMVLSTDGNLSINTTANVQKLRVYDSRGAAGYKTALFESNDTANGTRIVIANTGNTSGRGLGINVGGQSYGPGQDKASFGWYNADNTFSYLNALTISSDGKVNIGGNPKAKKLTVVDDQASQGGANDGTITNALAMFYGGDRTVVNSQCTTDRAIIHIKGQITDTGANSTGTHETGKITFTGRRATGARNEIKSFTEWNYNNQTAGGVMTFSTAPTSSNGSSDSKEVLRLHSGGDAAFYNALSINRNDSQYSGFTKAGIVLSTPAYNEYHFTWSGQQSYTIDFTCGSYFHSEFTYVQHQTNGGHHMHHYVRGKWANNHYAHTGFIYEHSGNGGALSVSFTVSDQSGGGSVNMKDGLTEAGTSGQAYRARYGGGHEGSSTTNNGRFRISETMATGSVSTRAVILKIYYGSLSGASIS